MRQKITFALTGGIRGLLGFTFAALMLGSCASEENLDLSYPSEVLASRSDATTDIIDVETAEYAASRVMNTPEEGAEITTPKVVSNSFAIRNSQGTPVMYAVNFEDDGGYVILSASKKTIPVVAFGESGGIDASGVDVDSFVGRLIERAKRRISASLYFPDDSLTVYAKHWASLLPPKNNAYVVPKSRSFEEYQIIIDKAVNKWIDEGCEVYEAKKWVNGEYVGFMYLSGLDNLLSMLSSEVTWADNKPQNELSFIVVRHNRTYSIQDVNCRPLNTNWITTAPYNMAVPNGMPLSSEAVALGRILYYYNDPSIQKFSSSPSNPLQNNTEIANFLYDVAKNINTVFGTSYSYATYGDLAAAFKYTYNYTFEAGQFDENGLIQSLKNGSPSIIVDYDQRGRSHTSVCDSYRVVSDYVTYTLWAPAGMPDDMYYGYESCGVWSETGASNFEFGQKANNIYFSPFWQGDDIHSQPPYYMHQVVRERKDDNKNK